MPDLQGVDVGAIRVVRPDTHHRKSKRRRVCAPLSVGLNFVLRVAQLNVHVLAVCMLLQSERIACFCYLQSGVCVPVQQLVSVAIIR